MEDLQEALRCKDSQTLRIKISNILHTGTVLLREGFRILLKEEHNNEIDRFVTDYPLLQDMKLLGADWVANSLKFVMLGVKDPIAFLFQLLKKLELIEESRKSDLRSF